MTLAAASGMEAAQNFIRIISNDLANSKSAGYKSGIAVFSTMISVDKAGVGSLSSANGTIIPAGVQIGLGTKTAAVVRNLTQGTPVQTENPYHIAIQGNGYFQIELPSGEKAYTRSGIFTLDNKGEIVTLEGFTVLPGITVPMNATSVTINASGEVSAKIDGQVNPQVLGQIELASFANPGGLQAIDNSLFLETQASGAPIVGQPGQEGYGKLLQYWYESSNVNTITGVTDLIEAQRMFELCSKAVKTEDEMLGQLKNIVS
jgi:flagellar basal-body rod protein FlgG